MTRNCGKLTRPHETRPGGRRAARLVGVGRHREPGPEASALRDCHLPSGLAVELDGAGQHPPVRSEDVPRRTSSASRNIPNYMFSWEGAIHYMWFKEYYPEEWPRCSSTWRRGPLAARRQLDQRRRRQHAVARIAVPPGAVRASGSSAQRVQQGPHDIYLPDCFGFGFSLPSIAAHSGLNCVLDAEADLGPRPIPFPIGRWKGVDGSEIVAALNPGALHDAHRNGHLDVDREVVGRPHAARRRQAVVFGYFGTGDTGGAPRRRVRRVARKVARPRQTARSRSATRPPISWRRI